MPHFYFFFRGEKLYVTKDKRLKKRWPRRIWWIVGFAICAVVLLIGFLAASKCFCAIDKNNRMDANCLSYVVFNFYF